jgi:hypothetical protein
MGSGTTSASRSTGRCSRLNSRVWFKHPALRGIDGVGARYAPSSGCSVEGAENLSWSGMSSAVRRLTQGALAPNPHTPVIHCRSGRHDHFTCFARSGRTELLDDPYASLQAVERWQIGPDSGRAVLPRLGQDARVQSANRSQNFLEELLANPVNERTVTNVYSSHHGCTDFLVRNRASSATEGRNLDSSIPTKDMP